ncbi:thiopeptide-type bacteriocin [Massilia consociata]|uniref:Thiopeptide-type bacteriocin n=1 Tax=Massilia consociata TaxID=760117 RepID=A0ABV6FFZ1_9BURK
MENIVIDNKEAGLDLTFEILETTEATAMEEMGASSTISASSSCSTVPTQPSVQ